MLPAGLRAADGAARLLTPLDRRAVCHAFYAEGGRTWYLPCAGTVLAFDIETTGLGRDDRVTCVCAYDPDRGVDFRACTPDGSACEDFLRLLDEAPLLCAFNGVRFDLPFLARRWGLARGRVSGWVRKLIDPFESCKLSLGVTFSLDRLLEANGIPCKTGCGLEAVRMAREGRWEELAEYCMQDTIKTHQVVRLGRVLLPQPKKNGGAAGLPQNESNASCK